jgi:hypothetical protein
MKNPHPTNDKKAKNFKKISAFVSSWQKNRSNKIDVIRAIRGKYCRRQSKKSVQICAICV